MEIKNPFILIIIILFFVLYFIFYRRKSVIYNGGSKIANTKFLESTDYFKKKLKEYKFYKRTLFLLFIICFICSSILLVRLSSVKTINDNQYNRDIFLCMDVSASVDSLNLELIDSFKETVSKLHGERFGISIFNTTSVVLVPLTEDYNYVDNVLDQIKKSIKANNPILYGTYDEDDYLYVSSYIYSGTLEGNEVRGSSLIGDGLATCTYSFSNLDSERTRIIILSTDNDLAGTPIISLEKAAEISKKNKIKVFGIGTKSMKSDNRLEFMKAVEITDGKYYDHSYSTVDNIVDDIELTSKSLLKNQVETKSLDLPEVPFITMLFSIIGLIFVSKKVIQ